jgi:hypothetical protein
MSTKLNSPRKVKFLLSQIKSYQTRDEMFWFDDRYKSQIDAKILLLQIVVSQPLH